MKTNPTEREISLIVQFLKNLDEQIKGKALEFDLKEFKHKCQVNEYEEKVEKLNSLVVEVATLTKMLKTFNKNSDKFAALEGEVGAQKSKTDVLNKRLESDFCRCELSLPLDLAILKAIHETMLRFADDWRDILAKAKPESKEPSK